MLIGLLAKNAILIVEFSVDVVKKGLSITQAAVNKERCSFTTNLMTSLPYIWFIAINVSARCW
jgi:HAE1 family hydrophobic/amphiphilic exporter-1